ncbi:hypothetical protein L798_09106 [Zootermopsis nevadensis]|uniref:Death-associated protein 1 n=1 Tax=Zootermopsis nevadensis TaxID=136037 RepID=A0A067R1E5_ZOONE|nr:hypothetical protein L798_09106 [Zootermopsis nevadensis]
MSSVEESELKGGHPPAVKAGGMRITQHKGPKDEKELKVTKEKEQVDEGDAILKVSTSMLHR